MAAPHRKLGYDVETLRSGPDAPGYEDAVDRILDLLDEVVYEEENDRAGQVRIDLRIVRDLPKHRIRISSLKLRDAFVEDVAAIPKGATTFRGEPVERLQALAEQGDPVESPRSPVFLLLSDWYRDEDDA